MNLYPTVLSDFCYWLPGAGTGHNSTPIYKYGALANRYVCEFDAKWLRSGAPPDEPLVGSGDIQSLNDLAGSFEVVQTMRPFPFSKTVVLQTAIAVLAPLLPLTLTMISLEDLLKRLLGILL